MDDCRSNARVHGVATQFNGRTQKIVELAQLNNIFVPDPDISEESDVDIEEMDNQFQEKDSDQSSLPPTLSSSLQDLLAELEEEEQQGKVPDLSNINLDNILEEDLNEIVRPTDNMPASSSFNMDDSNTTAITYASSSSSCKRKRQCKSSANKETKKRKLPSKQICKNTFNFTRDPFNGNIDNVLEDKFDVPQEIPTETDYFYKMFSEDIFELIVLRTNQRSVHETGASINTTKAEIKDFIAIHLLMGVIQLPSYLDYWSRQFRVPKIADVMPLKRYQKLRKYVRFVDPTETSTDRYFKLKPVIDIIRKNCRNIVNEKQQSIDEMMAPFKGTRAGSRKQYIKSKPHKWGFKIFVRSGVSGIVYDFIVYGEEISLPGIEEEFGLGGKVILKLCKTIPEPCLTAIYFDNFFTSLELLHYLRETYGILALGTIRSNRLRGCEIGMKEKKS
ncbi:uncharacterized protein LOC120354774 [Nilaparvata lugens]|uniref:uncharacterized protein LOC120354774 n=1 Tax=Nilaparvata lugens TaxID=108931 RepID=UPI00193D0E0B|nr:uncharacterized protein LOC120354774 [Nilaparvata lugens]